MPDEDVAGHHARPDIFRCQADGLANRPADAHSGDTTVEERPSLQISCRAVPEAEK